MYKMFRYCRIVYGSKVLAFLSLVWQLFFIIRYFLKEGLEECFTLDNFMFISSILFLTCLTFLFLKPLIETLYVYGFIFFLLQILDTIIGLIIFVLFLYLIGHITDGFYMIFWMTHPKLKEKALFLVSVFIIIFSFFDFFSKIVFIIFDKIKIIRYYGVK